MLKISITSWLLGLILIAIGCIVNSPKYSGGFVLAGFVAIINGISSYQCYKDIEKQKKESYDRRKEDRRGC